MTSRRVFVRMPDAVFQVDVASPQEVSVQRIEPVDAGSTGTRTDTDASGAQPGQPAVKAIGQNAGAGCIRLTVQGRSQLAWVAGDGDTKWVFVDGEVLQVTLADRPTPARRRSTGPEALVAPMPATVTRILVSPGQRVKSGEPLILLEAMKMELPLRASHDAVVKAIRCAEGDGVQPETVLIELEAS